jgi:aldehyde dehydrogenase (NAD+)
MSLQFTPTSAIPAAVAGTRAAFDGGALRTAAQRKAALLALAALLTENEAQLLAAVRADLSKNKYEFLLAELRLCASEAFSAIDALDANMAPHACHKAGIQKLDGVDVVYDALGTVLIIGAWNYPVQLLFAPLVGALSGGNTAVLKPSEVSPATAAAVAELVPKYFKNGIVTVVNGAIPETTALLAERFDHITYTGNSRVARIVMAAAAKNLTPVLLELGGKSPVVVDANSNIATVARRVMWGKLMNSGQTCIAPDYVLVDKTVKAQLIAELRAARDAFLGADPKECADYGRMVNDMHYARVAGLLSGGTVVVGGETDAAARYIAPTVLDDVDLASPLMTDEIFGPLLPVIAYETKDEAIAFINARDKPLALYIFSHSTKFSNDVIARTSAGGVTVNDTMMHAAYESLPFGGVGQSGMGAYHGEHSFRTYTHMKAVLRKQQVLEAANGLRYPPMSDRKLGILSALLFKTGAAPRFGLVQLLQVGVAAAAVAVAVKKFDLVKLIPGAK